jgi:hypothetical protein
MLIIGTELMIRKNSEILSLVGKCREERDIKRKIKLLKDINHLLPAKSKIKIPSLITADGINNLLSSIEVTLSPSVYKQT